MMKGGARARVLWIDCAKATAILAVIVNHCSILLFENELFNRSTYFSVGLFVLLSGMTAWMSAERDGRAFAKRQMMRTARLFGQYALAVLIALALSGGGLGDYFTRLKRFDALSLYYYLFILFQLMLVSPLLARWFGFCRQRRRRLPWYAGTMLAACGVAVLCVRYTELLPLYGGGKYLFGGTYFILYVLGMALASAGAFDRVQRARPVMLCASCALGGGWLALWSTGKLPLDGWCAPVLPEAINPPGVQLMIYVLLVLAAVYALFTTLESAGGCGLKIAKGFARLGGYSLYIYLYHIIVQNLLMTWLPWETMNIWLRRLVFPIPMIFVPVLGVWALRQLKGAYLRVRERDAAA